MLFVYEATPVFGIELPNLTDQQNTVFAWHIYRAACVPLRRYLSRFLLLQRNLLAAKSVQDEKDALVCAAQYKTDAIPALNKK
ncbi:Uncharacterised protein [Acinetobacter baumannii]|nr:Uncharacterised protein [Acinetobacter baumannii]